MRSFFYISGLCFLKLMFLVFIGCIEDVYFDIIYEYECISGE